jgi:hypothetical protein
MMKKFYTIVLLLAFALCAHAETLVLRTGARVRGTIVFQNDEVVIIRDLEGARFQYPRSEVEEILAAELVKDEPLVEPMGQKVTTSKKVSIALELGGGAACIPNETAGGGFSADILVGSHHIGPRHIFIGGGLGYHGSFIGKDQFNFLPIQVALRMPLIEQKHAPVFGLSLGYGIALSKSYLGGIYAGLDFGYRCALGEKTAIAVVASAQFQQAKVSVTEEIGGNTFANYTGRYLVTPELKLVFMF